MLLVMGLHDEAEVLVTVLSHRPGRQQEVS